MSKATAPKAWQQSMARVMDALAKIEDTLAELEAAHAIAPERWDFVADVNSIASDLQQIVERYKS